MNILLSEGRSKTRKSMARLWVAVGLIALGVGWTSCTSVSQMKKRYEAGDDSQYIKLLTVARRVDYPYATRKNAVTALGEIGDTRAVPTLEAILREFAQRTTLQTEALIALGRIGDPSAVTSIGRLLDRSLSSTGDEVRVAAIPVLGQLGGTEAAEILLNALAYYDIAMLRREQSVPKGVFTGDEQSIRALRDSLRRPDSVSTQGLGMFPGQQYQNTGLFGAASNTGAHIFEDPLPKERELAHLSLVRVGDPAVPVIEQHMSVRETTVSLRNELVEILLQIGEGQVPPPIDPG